MRLLLTTDTIGGVWTFTSELTAELMERGHDVFLVSLGRYPSDTQRQWISRIKTRYGDAFRYEASEIALEWMSNNKWAYYGAETLLLKAIWAFDPDVLHLSQFCFAALPVKLPKIITAHSDVLSWSTACRPEGLEESRWLNQYRDLVNNGLQSTDAVVVPTRWMGDELKRHYHLRGAPHVISNGRSIPMRDNVNPRRLQAVSVGPPFGMRGSKSVCWLR